MNIKDYGFLPEMMPENAMGLPARVTAVHRERYGLVCECGEIFGRLKTKEYYGGDEAFPTVGDFVLIRYNPGGDSQIIKTLPRRTVFWRKDPGPEPVGQAVAANYDYAFLMQSMNQNFNMKRLERYLAAARQSGAEPAVVLTKADLSDRPGDYVQRVLEIAPNVAVYPVSVKTGHGMEELAACMKPGKTAVFLGSSGVGKSSLVNALAGEAVMAVNGIRKEDGKGRHTTTHRQLLLLKNGAMIIDTPGMRQLGLWDVSEGLDETFADVEQFMGRCRFGNCKHRSEPGCAVRAALESGELSQKRLESFLKLEKEAKRFKTRTDLPARRADRMKK